jgi:hypothetical protein
LKDRHSFDFKDRKVIETVQCVEQRRK